MSPYLGTAASAGSWLDARGTWTLANGSAIYQHASTNGTSSSDQMIISQLRFAAAKSIRTSTIILATFNTIAAFATACGILFEGYGREKRNNRNFTLRRNGLSFIPACDVFPLVLSFGITIQGIVFAVAQSTGLSSLVGLGCTQVSEIVFPALFLVPYIQVVFGVEMVIRGLRSVPFAPRGKWGVPTCLAVVGLATLTNFLVADFNRASDFCLTSLFWFVAHWSVGCFALLTAISAVLLVCTIVIFVRLTRSTKIEVTERVAASRSVYYLAVAVISNTFMIPFFFTLAFGDSSSGDSNALNLSMVASVVANVTGLMTGGLYLFLKSKASSTIGPKDKAGEYERRKMKYKIRRADSSNGDLSGTGSTHMMSTLHRVDSEASLISYDKAEKVGTSTTPPPYQPSQQQPNPLRSNAVTNTAVPRPPQPVQTSPIRHMRKRSRSYSFKFPNRDTLFSNKASLTLLPATTYSPISGRTNDPNPSSFDLDILKPPPSMGNLMGRHRRDSSMISSATVQIGLRLSSMDDMPPIAMRQNNNSVYDLNCPEKTSTRAPRPPIIHAVDAGAAALTAKRPSPSPLQTQDLPRPDSDNETIIDVSPVRDPKMKTLPPVPAGGAAAREESREEEAEVSAAEVSEYETDSEEDESEGEEIVISTAEQKIITLSPTVYSPQSPSKAKLPSPRGVGFTATAAPPRRPNGSVSGSSTGTPRSPPMMAPPRRPTGGSTTMPSEHAKADWI